ncbi:prepilin-type N-terminal cleavage/methylation domain-containing protein, partial [Candidatus Aminicenantes bacterium AC-334-K16]|nr:prepilin-type N-terminal cleavage/methylation domain-containing protein [Candidatus Aminicenantes bacterium AC-334-K16]
MKNIWMVEKGFTLFEVLLSLGLISFILAACFHFFHLSRQHFLQLKQEEEIHSSLRTAVDKMTGEILQEGTNLAKATSLQLIAPLEIETNSILIKSGELKIKPKTDLVAGQSLIELSWPVNISS